MARVRILVLGFSVVAETPGFVELAREQLGPDSEIELRKIGLGGVHLHQLKFLLNSILDQNPCDLLILEVATPEYRWAKGDQPMAYAGLLNKIIGLMRQRCQPLAFLDLPHRDYPTDSDTLYRRHAALAEREGLPLRQVAFRPGLLRDQVHATAEGFACYAQELLVFIREILASGSIECQRKIAPPVDFRYPFDALALRDLPAVTETVFERFDRAGISVDMAVARPEEPLIFGLPADIRVCGLSYVIGPKSGKIRILARGHEVIVLAYDQFAYYRRIGVFLCDPISRKRIRIEQLPDQPAVQLLKGRADTGPRRGLIGHLLIERKALVG